MMRLPLSLTAIATTTSISSFYPSSLPFSCISALNFQSRTPNFFPAHTLLRFSGNGTSSHQPDHGSSSLQQCFLMRGDEEKNGSGDEMNNGLNKIGSNEEGRNEIPNQAQSVVEGPGQVLVSEFKPVPEVDYLQELLAIQQQGPKSIAFFGTRNMGFMHQELIEILSYAMIITNNHIFTSGASGTNAAVIRGALRAEKPELLTVILPQSLKMQPPESRELLSKVNFPSPVPR